jgi:UDP-glucose 4-epimerase
VLEVIAAFEAATGVKIPTQVVSRREGDVVAAFANPGKAERELGWKAERDLQAMCRDSWNWQQKNPLGF